MNKHNFKNYGSKEYKCRNLNIASYGFNNPHIHDIVNMLRKYREFIKHKFASYIITHILAKTNWIENIKYPII